MIQQSGMCINHVQKFSGKFFSNFSFFFSDNVISLIFCIKLFLAKSQKWGIFKPSLFNQFYSTLNFLSNGIQYVIFLGITIFMIIPKYKTNLQKKMMKKFIFKNGTYCISFERKFNVE